MNNRKLPKNFFEELDWSVLMESLDNLLVNRQLTNDNCQLTTNNLQLTTDNSVKMVSDEQLESVLTLASDLIHPQFREWHISRIYKLGCQEYINRYDKAKKYGKNKPMYFSALLKKH